MTNSTPEQETPSTIDWGLWFQWVLVTTLGWIIGVLLIGDIGIGIGIGVAQWVVLRQLGPKAAWWMIASALGWTAGWALVVSGAVVPSGAGPVSSLLAGAILGGTLGAAQWVVLRWFFSLAGWWIVVNILAWSIALTGVLGNFLVGAAAGAITGLALDWFFRYEFIKE